MGLFSFFHLADSHLQSYKQLEEEIVDLRKEAQLQHFQFVTFQNECNKRLSMINRELEKGKDDDLEKSKEIIQTKFKEGWRKYVQSISDLRNQLLKAQLKQESLLKHKSVRSYVTFKREDQSELKKAIDTLVLGYRTNEVERQDFQRAFFKILSLDVENPGIIEYLGEEMEKAQSEIFEDFVDVVREALGKGKKKTKYADGLIRNDKGELLFLRRNPESEFAPYQYGLPGGHVDLGESPADAVKREVEEETGLKVKSTELKLVYEDDRVIIYYFECTLESPTDIIVLERDGHFNYQWLSHEQRRKENLIPGLNSNLDKIYGGEDIEIEKSKSEQSGVKKKKLSPKDKFDVVMREYAKGTLRSGDGSVVTDRKQAIAIAYSESGLEKSEEIEKASEELEKPFTEEQIAEKYGITVEEAKKLLDDGEKVEKEHTRKKEIARTIASHHIYKESKDYYPELKKMESRFKDKGIEKSMNDICELVDLGEEDEQVLEKARKVFNNLTKEKMINRKGFLQTVYRSHPEQASKTNPDRLKVNEKVTVAGGEMDVDSFVRKFGHRINYTIKQHPETRRMYVHRGGEDKIGGKVREIQLKPFRLLHEFDEDTMEHLTSYFNGKEVSKEEGMDHEREMEQMGFKLIREREQSEE